MRNSRRPQGHTSKVQSPRGPVRIQQISRRNGMASKWKAGTLVAALMLSTMSSVYAGPKDGPQLGNDGGRRIRHVLLISIDGMHAIDFLNCSKGVSGANGGAPYCPNLAELGE